MSRALKRSVRPRLATEQGKGSACNSDWITAAGKSSQSHDIKVRTTILFLKSTLNTLRYWYKTSLVNLPLLEYMIFINH